MLGERSVCRPFIGSALSGLGHAPLCVSSLQANGGPLLSAPTAGFVASRAAEVFFRADLFLSFSNCRPFVGHRMAFLARPMPSAAVSSAAVVGGHIISSSTCTPVALEVCPLVTAAPTPVSSVARLNTPYDRERLEDVGFMTCMTLVLLGNYAQTGHFGGPLAYTPFNVATHLAGPGARRAALRLPPAQASLQRQVHARRRALHPDVLRALDDHGPGAGAQVQGHRRQALLRRSRGRDAADRRARLPPRRRRAEDAAAGSRARRPSAVRPGEGARHQGAVRPRREHRRHQRRQRRTLRRRRRDGGRQGRVLGHRRRARWPARRSSPSKASSR